MDEKTILAIRAAFKEVRAMIEIHEQRIKELERIVDGHKTLLVDLRGDSAYQLHTSFGKEPEKIEK